jgi:hypothetical protein
LAYRRRTYTLGRLVAMTLIKPGLKLVYHGKELMLSGTVLTIKEVRTYNVDGVFETLATFDETGDSEYNIRFFVLEFHGIKPGTPIPI